MKTIALIGLGVISEHYLYALENNQNFSLVAVADLNENCASKNLYAKYPFFTDYKQMIASKRPDFVLIATPPKTHYAIAKDCLNLGVSVISEKPAVLNMEDYDALIDLASEKNLTYEVMYHWQHGSEMLAFEQNYSAQKITEISVFISDDYSDGNGSIIESRRVLAGAWFDSGINALSMIKRLLPFNQVEVVKAQKIDCKESGLPIFCIVDFIIDGVKVKITIDWQHRQKEKYTELLYDGAKMLLHNGEQRIYYQGRIINADYLPRLNAHYYNYFNSYKGATAKDNRILQQLLLSVDEKL